MKLIDRGMYLRKLIGVIGTPDIKVVTGVRRCGKSKLLEAFKGYVEANIADANIVHINFNLTKYEKFKDYHVLNDYIESAYADGKQNFVLIDEVQMCPDFELAINNLHAQERFDIYITGSNAFLLSSDLAAALPDSRLWLGSAGLVLIATVLPYIFYTKGLEGVESGKASIIANVEPVVAALTGVVFFHETPSIWTLLGVCCVLGGVILLAKGDDTCKESNSSTAST